MRLVNTQTLQLRSFTEDASSINFPRYAILSHTWSEDEVTFEEFKDLQKHRKRSAFKKIAGCCAQARRDGLQWAWIDSCCIDKSSSAELSEAINSMYRWYEASTVCYAYIADFEYDGRDTAYFSRLRKCRWFRRGWTLQELVAPMRVDFFDQHWRKFTDRSELAEELAAWTDIPAEVLRQTESRLSVPVADRMAWARGRSTTRVEDQAYCLLGIFNVNMPLLYGEGGRAFSRLQNEILRTTSDDTILLGGLIHATETGDWYSEATLPHGRWSGRLLSHPDSPGKGIAMPDTRALRIDPPMIIPAGLRLDLPLKMVVLPRSQTDEDTTTAAGSLLGDYKGRPVIYYGALNCTDGTGQKRLARYFRVLDELQDHLGPVMHLQARDWYSCWFPVEDVRTWEITRCIISMAYKPKHATILPDPSVWQGEDPLLTASVQCERCGRQGYGWTWARRQARRGSLMKLVEYTYLLELAGPKTKSHLGLVFLAPTESYEGAGRVGIYELPSEEPGQLLDCVWDDVYNSHKALLAGETPEAVGGTWSQPMLAGLGPRARLTCVVPACCRKVRLEAALYCGQTNKGNLDFRPEYRLRPVGA